MTELAVLAGVGLAVAVAAWLLRRRDGRISAVDTTRVAPSALVRLGVPGDASALIQFTAPSCRSCDAARAVLDEVAGSYDSVRVVTADVGEHLDLAREHGIMRAPTTLVVDPDGLVRHRVDGVPDPGQLHDLLRASGGRAA